MRLLQGQRRAATRSHADREGARFVELVRVSTNGQVLKDTAEAQRRALDGLREVRPGRLVERIEFDGNVSAAKGLAAPPDLVALACLSARRAYDELRVVAIG